MSPAAGLFDKDVINQRNDARKKDSDSIRHTEKENRGRYWVDTNAGEAELTYSAPKADHIIIHSTFVPIEARGGGVAAALVKRAIDDARAAGRKITSRCNYVDRLFARHPEWRDLLANS
ncbi:MAG: GNAT family N-acetyltransferase [Parvularculaceae bacterium]